MNIKEILNWRYSTKEFDINKKISDACYPISVKMGKEMRDGTLVLNVIHGKEMEVEYEKTEIIDKINKGSAKVFPYRIKH